MSGPCRGLPTAEMRSPSIFAPTQKPKGGERRRRLGDGRADARRLRSDWRPASRLARPVDFRKPPHTRSDRGGGLRLSARLGTRSGKGILSIPYSQEVNDYPSIVTHHQEDATFAAMIEDTVEQLLSECDRRPSVLGIALHPYILGQPHRALRFERVLTRLREAADLPTWWTTAGAIAQHVTRTCETSG